MAFFNWSQTANTNASADSTINFAEGQAPSSLNDSSRAVMARLREWGNDIAGAIVTGGTSTAYTVTSNQVFDSLAHLNGQVIAFTPHTTNGATVTLNVDSQGAKPLRASPNVELQSGILIQGTPYVAIYNNSDSAFYLFGNAGYSPIPLGIGMDYWGSTAPSTAFAFAYGQAISRTTYSALFSLFSTIYGTGDGSTTFNLPDCRGRVTAKLDNMGGSTASRLTTATINQNGGPTTLGANGGTETSTLQTANLPPYTPTTASATFSGSPTSTNVPSGSVGGNLASTSNGTSGTYTPTGTVSVTMNAQGGTSTAFSNAQPTIMCNYLIRII